MVWPIGKASALARVRGRAGDRVALGPRTEDADLTAAMFVFFAPGHIAPRLDDFVILCLLYLSRSKEIYPRPD